MSEELKPCPACGNKNVVTRRACDNYFVRCPYCCMSGPMDYVIAVAEAAWNALPRAPHITPNDVDCKGCPERRPGLAWTTEPPTVPGWYWWRWHKGAENMPLEVREGLIVEYPRRILRAVADIGGQWAGPIPGPEETS